METREAEVIKQRLFSYLNTLYGYVWDVKVKTLKGSDEKLILEGSFEEGLLGPVHRFRAEMEKRFPYKLIELEID
jgi:hypothetical protein